MKVLDKKIVVVILTIIISAIIGVIAITVLPKFPVVSDSLDYDTIARNILANHEYLTISAEEIIYPPLYPIFLSVIYSFSINNYGITFFFQFLLLGGIGIFSYLILRDILNIPKKYSVITIILTLVWPYFILYSLLISSEILFTLFLTGSFFFFLKFIDNPNNQNVLLTALFIGLAVLTRPVALLLPFWVFIGCLIMHFVKINKFSKNHFKKGLLILIIFIATLIPWIAYVNIKYDRFVPVASNLSYVFNKANKSLEYLGKNDLEESRDESKSVDTKGLAIAKLKNIYLFWNPGAGGYNVEKVINKHPEASIFVTVYKVLFFALLLLAILSLKSTLRRKEIIISALVILYFWALHTVLFPFPRYTLPIIPIVIMMALYTISKIKLRTCHIKY